MFFKTIAILISVCFVLIAGNDKKEQGRKGDSDKTRRAMWYQPPVIKRQAMDDEDRRVFFRMIEEAKEADAMKDYSRLGRPLPDEYRVTPLDQDMRGLFRVLEEAKKADAMKDHSQLGRRLPDEFRVTPLDQDIYKIKEQIGRSPYYYPRPLPARTEFFPQLNKEMSYDEIPEGYKYIPIML